MALATKITAALTHLGPRFPFWAILSIYIDATFGIEIESCHSASFRCYADCCLKEGWFCDHREERCRQCDVWKSLCGNDSVPLGCQLYCYKQQHPLPNPADKDVDNSCMPWSTFVAAVVTLAAALVIFLTVMVTVCMWVRRKPPEQWPAFLRVFLGLNRSQTIFKDGRNEKNPKGTEEGTPMLEQQNTTAKDVDTNSEATNTQKPSSASLTSQNSSSCSSAATGDLNLSRVDNEDSDGQGQAADHQGDPPLTMSARTSTEASTSPGRSTANPGPAPYQDFEVRSQSRTSAFGRNVPAGISKHPGNNPSSPQQGPQPRHDQPGPGLLVNNPNFSAMTPTNEIGRPQDRVVDTGTDNPARSYDLKLAPVQPTD